MKWLRVITSQQSGVDVFRVPVKKCWKEEEPQTVTNILLLLFLLMSNCQTFGNNMKLKALKVRPKKLLEASPCIGEMGAMLECWSRSGVDDPRCAQTAKALANCMSKPVSTAAMRGIDHLEIG